MAKELWKGNEAIAEAAIRGGCDCFFGYPITPQSEVPEYLSLHMPKHGKVFVQAESEVAAINMVYGAAAAGKRVMTSSSSLGVSLKQEGMSYLCSTELPAVIINCMRGGPGLGTIQPAQGDYFQATRGGGSGDYRTIVLAPANIQELADYVQEAFELADLYRNPVMVLADGLIGQMMEPIEWKELPKRELPSKKDWAVEGRKGAEFHHVITPIFAGPEECNDFNERMLKKHEEITKNEIRYEETETEDCEILFTAYGTPARIILTAIDELRAQGIKAGLFRPITLWPFPEEQLRKTINQDCVKVVLDVEMSAGGQMIEDVRLANEGAKPIKYYGVSGGEIPTLENIIDAAKKALEEVK